MDDQLFQDIFDLPQDVQVSNIDVPKPEVLVVENKSVEDGSKPPIVVINIRWFIDGGERGEGGFEIILDFSADNLDYLDYLGPQDRVRGRTVVKSVNTDNDEISVDTKTLRRLENIMETFVARKIAAEDHSDDLDFDTDTITITMDSDNLSPLTNWRQRRQRRPAYHSAYYRPYYNYYYSKWNIVSLQWLLVSSQ